MTPRRCAACPNLLLARQQRCCSVACWRRVNAPRMADCATCGRPFRWRARSSVACSVACAAESPRWPWRRVLDLLLANRHAVMTSADLAIWAYGSDDLADRKAVRQTIYRLVRMGHRVERSRVHDAGRGPWIAAYRLGGGRAGACRVKNCQLKQAACE